MKAETVAVALGPVSDVRALVRVFEPHGPRSKPIRVVLDQGRSFEWSPALGGSPKATAEYIRLCGRKGVTVTLTAEPYGGIFATITHAHGRAHLLVFAGGP